MAAGDITWFNAAKAFDYFVGWAGTDSVKVALVTTTTTPAATTATPSLGDFTQVTAGGNYTAGGDVLDTWANMWNDPTAGGTATFDDTGASVTWAQNASNPSDARWAIIYNDTQAGDPAIAFVDLGAVIDMTAGDLTITWNASGIATVS